jgi:hypothetical protein
MSFFKGASAKVSKKLISCSRPLDLPGQGPSIQPGSIPATRAPDEATKNESSAGGKSTSTDTVSTTDQNAYIEHDITVLEWIRSLLPSKDGGLNYLKSLFPCIDWIPRYNWRWLLGDSIAGLTVGLVVVPQAMAYALLADLTPEFGLYTSFVGAAIYWLFGTSKDIVIGVSFQPFIHSCFLCTRQLTVLLDDGRGLFARRIGDFGGAGLPPWHVLEARCCEDSVVHLGSHHAACRLPAPRLDHRYHPIYPHLRVCDLREHHRYVDTVSSHDGDHRNQYQRIPLSCHHRDA